MAGNLFFKAGVAAGSKDEDYSENEDISKVYLGGTDSTTQTAGSVNTTKSQGSTVNSGSTNTTKIGASTSSTFNSGHTDTQQLLLSDEAVNHLANEMLESTSGLASTVKGSNISGVYNDTARTLLSGNLVAKIAGDVEARRAVLKTVVGGSSSTTYNSGRDDVNIIGGSASTTANDIIQNVGPTTSTTHQTTETDEHTIKQTEGSKDTEEKKASSEGGWILCTELYNQGRMNREFYRHGLRAFSKYDEQSKKGYYIWAVPALKHLRAHPNSFLSRVMCYLLNARAEYISAESGCPVARKTLAGLFAKNLYWGCWLLSRTVARNYGVPTGDYHANATQ